MSYRIRIAIPVFGAALLLASAAFAQGTVGSPVGTVGSSSGTYNGQNMVVPHGSPSGHGSLESAPYQQNTSSAPGPRSSETDGAVTSPSGQIVPGTGTPQIEQTPR